MANPVVVEAMRGDRMESTHRGAGAVVDADGRGGDGLWRRRAGGLSALRRQGAAGPCHSSQAAARTAWVSATRRLRSAARLTREVEDHVATARGMLAKAGYDKRALECGAHWPLGEDEARALARSGRTPTCSGTTMVLGQACGLRLSFLRHRRGSERLCSGRIIPFSARLRRRSKAMSGARLSEAMRGVDGCAIPTYAVPLVALAPKLRARLGTGHGLSRRERRDAAARIRAAVAAHPLTVAGRGRFGTRK